MRSPPSAERSEECGEQRDEAGGDEAEHDAPKIGAHGFAGSLDAATASLEDEAADAAREPDRDLGDDGADDGVRRREPQRGEQERHARREAELARASTTSPPRSCA